MIESFQKEARKVGNSLIITIPSPAAKKLNIDEGDLLDIVIKKSEGAISTYDKVHVELFRLTRKLYKDFPKKIVQLTKEDRIKELKLTIDSKLYSIFRKMKELEELEKDLK